MTVGLVEMRQSGIMRPSILFDFFKFRNGFVVLIGAKKRDRPFEMLGCFLVLAALINLPKRNPDDHRHNQSTSYNKKPTLLLNETQGPLGEEYEVVGLPEFLTGQVLSAGRHNF